MKILSKHISLQYAGFLNTPMLWDDDVVFGLHQFHLPDLNYSAFEGVIDSKLRLGKRVERFVSYMLQDYNTINILAENIQIQKNKHTLGELDCLLKYNNTPIHLEIVYKFYLYDPSVGDTELEHWIGPNRKDSLLKKLNKLKEKQLPLLFTPECKTTLKRLNINIQNIKQKVYFKAQLFVPLNMKNHVFEQINNNCIQGVYMHLSELVGFTDCKFHMPSKINWLIDIQTQVNWLSYEQFKPLIEAIISQQISPLCWLKRPNGQTYKCFITWWT